MPACKHLPIRAEDKGITDFHSSSSPRHFEASCVCVCQPEQPPAQWTQWVKIHTSWVKRKQRQKTHNFHGLSVFGLHLCEVTVRALLLWGLRTDLTQLISKPQMAVSDQLTYSCREAEGGHSRWMFGLNHVGRVPLLSVCWQYKTLMCHWEWTHPLLA